MYDVIIRNGTVVDGTARTRYRADVGIQGDHIAAIGDLREAEARRLIDAGGRVVAPGFIDVHNHSDGWLVRRSHLTAKTMQGFTTEVLMSDGISYAPVNQRIAPEWLLYLRALDGLRMADYDGWRTIAEFLERIHRRNVQNAAAQVPYANVRALACGFAGEPADDFRMRQIRADIAQALGDGAVGISTGLDYIVQCHATTDELVEACLPLRDTGGVYATHIRYKKGLLPALKEAVAIGRRAGVPVHISHLKTHEPAQIEAILEYIDREARHEVDLTFDVYPYQSGSTMLSYLLPYQAWDDGPTAAMARMRDPALQQRLRRGLELYRADLANVRIAWVAGSDNAAHQGQTLAEFIAQRGCPAEQAVWELLTEERLAVLMVVNEGDDRLIDPFLTHDLAMIGSDGIYHDDGLIHPRVYGTAGRLLGSCVRERRILSLEEAVHKLSGKAAERFGLVGRGVLREGAFADVVVFDPETIADRATYEDPHQTTVGVEHVLVNGVAIVSEGTPVELPQGELPGRALRFGV